MPVIIVMDMLAELAEINYMYYVHLAIEMDLKKMQNT